MILNKIEDLQENQVFYDILNKGIRENYRRYLVEAEIIKGQDIYKWMVHCSDVREIRFYWQYMIFHYTNGNSRILRYAALVDFKLTYLKGGS